jgi:hypothetical protein
VASKHGFDSENGLHLPTLPRDIRTDGLLGSEVTSKNHASVATTTNKVCWHDRIEWIGRPNEDNVAFSRSICHDT